MEKPTIEVYVRYCETDAGGHVSNTSYFLYLEEARTKFFETIGFGLGKRHDVNFIVARTECDFVAQAYAAQRLSVTTVISNIGTKSFTMKHEILDTETGAVIAKGGTVTVCFDFDTQQSIKVTPALRSALEKYVDSSCTLNV